MGLQDCILEEGGVACGLPLLREGHRVRMAGQTFSIEDARRDFCNDWSISEKMRKYALFIDQAMRGDLDSAPMPRKIMEPLPSQPSQLAGDASADVAVAKSGLPEPSIEGTKDAVYDPRANVTGDG